ncbi:hypothetical protein AAEX28_14650 [Lentisphaerota bacterium WC36G]|nr:hypothetical protein LJT99_01405 [Lentisphaerae bacterium WC36]
MKNYFSKKNFSEKLFIYLLITHCFATICFILAVGILNQNMSLEITKLVLLSTLLGPFVMPFFWNSLILFIPAGIGTLLISPVFINILSMQFTKLKTKFKLSLWFIGALLWTSIGFFLLTNVIP